MPGRWAGEWLRVCAPGPIPGRSPRHLTEKALGSGKKALTLTLPLDPTQHFQRVITTGLTNRLEARRMTPEGAPRGKAGCVRLKIPCY